jgi:hypothetical protein
VKVLNIQNLRKRFLAVLGSTLAGLMFATGVDATNPENVAVEVTFVAVITVTEVTPLQFGLLDVLMGVGETVVIAPNDGLTDAGANVIGGSQLAADLTIGATATAGINILIDNVVTPGGADYTLTLWRCEYDVIAEAVCDGSGMNIASAVASGALRVGVTLTGLGSASIGNQDATFDVTVAYQ